MSTKVFALVTGRGNNTMKDKNIRIINGKPLIYYPTKAALDSSLVNKVFISSDDENILNSMPELNTIKIKRPKELAQPNSKHIDAIIHALNVFENEQNKPEILVVLLANSLTVKSEWITSCIEEIKQDPTIDAVVPVYNEQDHHPFRAKKINKDGYLESWFNFGEDQISTNRQELPNNYFLGHNFWVLNLKNRELTDSGQKPWTFLGHKIKPFIVDECFDVHDEHDLERSERWLAKNSWK